MPCLFTSNMDRWMDEKAYIRETTWIYGLDTVLGSRIRNITVHYITFRMNWPCMEKQVHLSSLKAAVFWTGSKNRWITGGTTAQGTGWYCSRLLLLNGANQLVLLSSHRVLWNKSNQIFIRWVKLHRRVHLLTPFFFCNMQSYLFLRTRYLVPISSNCHQYLQIIKHPSKSYNASTSF